MIILKVKIISEMKEKNIDFVEIKTFDLELKKYFNECEDFIQNVSNEN
jgi:hypothetical protein